MDRQPDEIAAGGGGDEADEVPSTNVAMNATLETTKGF